MILAHVTDTHIRERGRLTYRRVDSARALAACVEHLVALRHPPDAVVVSGDLVDFGLPAEYELFRELVRPLTVPLYVVPGNHDERAALRQAFPDHSYLRQDERFLHFAIEAHPVRLVGLDTTTPGAPGGMMCPDRLRWLDSCLASEPGRPTLLFMHHPPFPTGIGHMDVQNCGNAEGLAEVVSRHPQVRRVLCGHVHRSVQVTWAGIETSIGPSPSHAVALDLDPAGPPAFVLEPPGCHILTYHPARGFTTHLIFIGAFEGPHPFFSAGGALID